MSRFSCLMFVFLLAGCGGMAANQPADAEPYQVCAEPRAQVCTMQYAPVCAVGADDKRREYSNACAACAQPSVKAYISGPCPQ